MKKFFISLLGFALIAAPVVYSQETANNQATNQNVSEFRLRQAPQTQSTVNTFGRRDYSQWSLFMDLGLNAFVGDMTPSFEPTLSDPLRHFTVGGGVEYTLNPMFSIGLGYAFHRYGMSDESASFQGRLHNIYPFVGINLLNFPMFNRNSRWDLWAYAGLGAAHFDADLTHNEDRLRNLPADAAERDAIINESHSRWTGVIPMALELSFDVTRSLALSLRAQYFMYTSDDLEGQSVKRPELGNDRYNRKNYNLSGTSNDHIAALTLGLRWNITPRDRVHMRNIRWEGFVPQRADQQLNNAMARIENLENRVDNVENQIAGLADEMNNLLANLPEMLAEIAEIDGIVGAGAGAGLARLAGNDGELPIPPVFIFFDLDRHSLRPDALKSILLIASIMNSHPNIVIDVVGLTDVRGSVAHNDALSIRRANEVRNELVNVWGICPSRITHEGRGKAVAPDPNNPRFFQINRRVEVKFFLRR